MRTFKWPKDSKALNLQVGTYYWMEALFIIIISVRSSTSCQRSLAILYKTFKRLLPIRKHN